MQTVAAAIGERIEELRELLREFLLEHSGSLRDINKPRSSLDFVGPQYAWGDLDQEGRRLQSRLLDDYPSRLRVRTSSSGPRASSRS